MFVTGDDFTERPYRIPNQAESKDLPAFIEVQERNLLIDLLGYPLYYELRVSQSSSTIEPRFEALKSGHDYTYNGKTYRYDGIVNVLKPAIYSRWIDPNTYKLTNVGMIVNDPTPNSTIIAQDEFVTHTWNDYVYLVGSDCHQENTLYGYMKQSNLFPEWSFKQPKLKNRWSL